MLTQSRYLLSGMESPVGMARHLVFSGRLGESPLLRNGLRPHQKELWYTVTCPYSAESDSYTSRINAMCSWVASRVLHTKVSHTAMEFISLLSTLNRFWIATASPGKHSSISLPSLSSFGWSLDGHVFT